MDDSELLGSAIAMTSALARRTVSARELLELHFGRIDRLNPRLNAVIWQDREKARQQASELDAEAAAGRFRGPLHGLPVTLKDSFDLAGAPSTWGNPAWKDNIARNDSEVAARYREAGAIIFGKTNVPLNLYEWQSFNEIYGTTNNPWDPGRTPGGSSGGSAVALATGMAALEAGSDIGSSIRNPAHYCGIFGLKPSWGVVPLQGHQPPGWLGDIDIGVTGPMTRHACDLELAFDVLAGADRFHRPAWAVDCPADRRERLSEFRIAIKLGDPASAVDDTYLHILEQFGRKLQSAGADVSFDAEPAIDAQEHFDLYLTLLGAAMAFAYREQDASEERAAIEALGDPIAERIMGPRIAGRIIRHADWQMADNRRRAARLVFDDFFRDRDILIAPVCASAAFPHDQQGKRHQRYIPVNGKPQYEMQQLFWSGYCGVVGLPAVVGPAGSVGGLPVGYQAIAGYGRDRSAIAFARAVEREIGGFSPPPAIQPDKDHQRDGTTP